MTACFSWKTSYTEPAAWYLYDPAAANGAGALKKTALVNTSPVDFSDIEEVREFAVGKDGARIPVNILRRKGTQARWPQPRAPHRLRRIRHQPAARASISRSGCGSTAAG